MNTDEIVGTLSALKELRIASSDERIVIHVPAIDDCVHLFPQHIDRALAIYSPTGEPAIELAIGDEGDLWPLIFTNQDVVFAPLSGPELLDSPIPINIGNAPPIVAYSEMQRDAEAIARAAENSAELNFDAMAGSLLLIRCFVGGATRFGLRPLRTVAWWQRAWDSIGEEVGLPPFLSDAVWEEMAEEALQIELVATPRKEPEDTEAILTALKVADFEVLEPAVNVVKLDEEFVNAWKQWVPITPRKFADILMKGQQQEKAYLSFYPDGGGTIEVEAFDGDEVGAFLQLGVSFPDDKMNIDEIRISEARSGTGLFQRWIFNSQLLAEALGLREVRLTATGIGSYALAKVGVYPQDPEMARKVRD